MPVAGEPLIRWIIRWLVTQGVTDLVLNLHHRPETIASVVGDGSDLGARVRYSWEQPAVLGSAGGPRQALSLVGADTFFIINGDTLTDVDLTALAAAHDESGAVATLALVPNRHFDRYGGVLLDAERRVTGFVRRGPSAKGSYHFIGVQVAHADAFSAVRAGDAADRSAASTMRSSRSVLERFADSSRTPNSGMSERSPTIGRRPRAFAGRHRGDRAMTARPPRIDPTAQRHRLDPLGRCRDRCASGDRECILTDGVHVPAGATYRDAILMQRDGDLAAIESTVP